MATPTLLDAVFEVELPPGWTLKQLKDQLEGECGISIKSLDYMGSNNATCYCLMQEEDGLKSRFSLLGLYRTVDEAKLAAQVMASRMLESGGLPTTPLAWKRDVNVERCWASEETEFFILTRNIL